MCALKIFKTFKDSFIIIVVLFLIVQRVPNLRKEGVDFGFGIVIPRPGQFFGAPVTAF